MSKECVQCGFITLDDAALECPQCAGRRLRFSLLAGLQVPEPERPTEKIKAAEKPLPTFGQRVGHVLQYVVWTHVAAFFLCGAALSMLSDKEFRRDKPLATSLETLATTYPQQLMLAQMAIPALAAVAAAVFALRGVYLAQQVAGVMGPISALSMLVGAKAAGMPIFSEVWLLAPVISALAAFLAGLRMAKIVRPEDLETPQEIEYQTFDAWDRSAKARYVEGRVTLRTHWNRYVLGVVVGLLSFYVMSKALDAFAGGRAARAGAANRRAELGFELFAIFLAGVGAASGTKTPFRQGAAVALTLFVIGYGYRFNSLNQQQLPMLFAYIGAGIAGGILGRNALGPAKVYRGKILDKRDELVYVGSEATRPI